jgi:hypothetical protein
VDLGSGLTGLPDHDILGYLIYFIGFGHGTTWYRIFLLLLAKCSSFLTALNSWLELKVMRVLHFAETGLNQFYHCIQNRTTCTGTGYKTTLGGRNAERPGFTGKLRLCRAHSFRLEKKTPCYFETADAWTLC